RADDARAGNAEQQAQRDDDLRHAGPDHRHDDDEDDEIGEALPGVDEALRDEVDLAAEIAGDDTDDDRDQRGEARRTEADDDGKLGAVYATREHVAAEVVGAERIGPRRRLEAV